MQMLVRPGSLVDRLLDPSAPSAMDVYLAQSKLTYDLLMPYPDPDSPDRLSPNGDVIRYSAANGCDVQPPHSDAEKLRNQIQWITLMLAPKIDEFHRIRKALLGSGPPVMMRGDPIQTLKGLRDEILVWSKIKARLEKQLTWEPEELLAEVQQIRLEKQQQRESDRLNQLALAASTITLDPDERN